VFSVRMIKRSFLILLSLSIINSNEAAYKILVYSPKFGHSHSMFMGRIADILVEEGHNVTTLIPIMDPRVVDGTEKSNKIYIDADPVVAHSYTSNTANDMFGLRMFNPITTLFLSKLFETIIGRTCKKLLGEPGFIERLKAEEYDVFIVENFEVCGMGISEAIQPKALIGAASTCLYAFQFEDFGVPQALSHRPS
ncbi:hypothetical protein PENTCL1PPCAC_29429, partial [Pristionchus entomophagus]